MFNHAGGVHNTNYFLSISIMSRKKEKYKTGLQQACEIHFRPRKVLQMSSPRMVSDNQQPL